MVIFKMNLFGSPTCRHGDDELTIRRRKGTALLAYLVVTGRPHSRESLATLLWPEMGQSAALQNLRRELARLNKDVGPDLITADRKTIALNSSANSWVDVTEFETNLAQVQAHDHFPVEACPTCLKALRTAVDLYTADFMDGFNLPDCREYDEWQYFQREGLRQSLAGSLMKLINWHCRQKEYEPAIAYGRHWLSLDPLNEAAQRELMRLYALSGQQAAALRQYESCVQLLDEELGVEPEAETVALYNAIRDREFVPESEPEQIRPAPSPRHNLPVPPTPFIGRTRELADLRQLLRTEPSPRLLTLLGPAGIGKTRLALATASAERERYPHGVHFVPLAPLKTAEHIAPTIAEFAGLELRGGADPAEQLLDQLSGQEMLLVLDNLEHILDGADYIARILRQAPSLTLLVTSRERLNLDGEAVYPVSGLQFPALESPVTRETAVESEAIQLLYQHARRVRPHLEARAADWDHMARICRLVQGMPLALVLAAGWLELLSWQEIVEELARSLDILESQMRDVPARQRSVRAAFDMSWQRLSAADQALFMKLSVFLGGFDRQAAQRITGAGLPGLRTLVHKSFITVDEARRYQIHELLRQYGAEKLTADGSDTAVRTAHSDYYLEALHQMELDLKGRRQLFALREIETDFENIRAAWLWAVAVNNHSAINRSLESLHLFCAAQKRYGVGWDLFSAALVEMQWVGLEMSQTGLAETRHRLLVRLRFMQIYTAGGNDRDIQGDIEQTLAAARQRGDESEIAFCLFALGGSSILFEEDITVSIAILEESLALYQTLGDLFYQARLFAWLAYCQGSQANFETELELIRRSMELSQQAGSLTDAAMALLNLLGLSLVMGKLETAESYGYDAVAAAEQLGQDALAASAKLLLAFKFFIEGEQERCDALVREGLKLAEENQYLVAMAYGSGVGSILASVDGDCFEGKRLAGESLANPLNDTLGRAIANWGLALAHCCDEQWADGLGALLQAVSQLGGPTAKPAIIVWLLPVAACLSAGAGHQEWAASLMGLAESHSLQVTGWLAGWPRFAEVQAALKQELGVEKYRSAWEAGSRMELAEVVANLEAQSDPKAAVTW